LVLTLLWLTFRAVSGVLPVITQILLIEIVGFECRNATGFGFFWQG
jgi:hypothetical protein